MNATPTKLTLDLLRQLGYVVAVVEQWIRAPKPKDPHFMFRRDLWGFADVLGFHPRDGMFLLVQCTSYGHVKDRLDKAKKRPELAQWLKAGGTFEVWGWGKVDGKAEVKRVGVQAGDLETVLLSAPKRKKKGREDRQGRLFG